MNELDSWQQLLQKYADSELFHRHYRSEYTPLFAGNALVIEWVINLDNDESHTLNVRFNVTRNTRVGSLFLYIANSVAYIGIEEVDESEQRFRRLPDVWQLYGIEGNPEVPIPEWRSEEVLVML